MLRPLSVCASAENGELLPEGEAGLMRFPAFFAPHPWLRNGLVLIAVAAMLWGGARLWTSGPDAVHITITHGERDPETLRTLTRRVTYDRTIPSGAVAQRLQRDLAAMPLIGPFDTVGCFIDKPVYDAYTLTWYRAGLPVEQASVSRTACAIWADDGVFSRLPRADQAIYADIYAAVNASG
jgi:hypothetical protein